MASSSLAQILGKKPSFTFNASESDKPNREVALRQYKSRAGVYNFEIAFAEPIRRVCVARLRLKPGEMVLDVACGTGLSFRRLRQQVGPQGQVIGIEQSAEMIEQARDLIKRESWTNVELIHAPVEKAVIPHDTDAALFHFTHDVLCSPKAVRNVLRAMKPGGRIVAAGLKWAPAWAVPVNIAVFYAAARSITALEGLETPWKHLAEMIPDLRVQSLGGGIYIADGTVPAELSTGRAA